MTAFALRPISDGLRQHYLEQGWWSDDTLGALVDRSLAAAPTTRVEVWSRENPWQGTYADVADEARRLIGVLRAHGLERGDVVAFQLPNRREAITAFYALAMGGFVLVPIVHIYGRKEVGYILRESRARAYVSAPAFGHIDYTEIVDTEAHDLGDLELHLLTDQPTGPGPAGIERIGWTAVDAAEPADPVTGGEPDDVVVLAYTSGTTSNPKGVVHTHRTLLAELEHMRRWSDSTQTNLMGSPVTHATGMLGAVLTPITVGQPIHVIDRWDPGWVLEIMIEAGISAGNGASFFLASLLEHPDFSAEHAALMPRVGLGGAPVPPVLGELAASHGIRIIRAYGSTEHPSISGCDYDDGADKRHHTDGRPLAGVELRLVDDDGIDVAPGTAGEILSRGPELCIGYTDPDLTRATFDDDGWYRTGDMGVLDDDGYLTITDRVKDVIIRGGENISAAEVEDALAHVAGVAEVAVVATPDARLGEQACALVRLSPGADAPTLAELQAHLEHIGLARQKWPEKLQVVDDFPRTATGKIRKVDLRRQLRQQAT